MYTNIENRCDIAQNTLELRHVAPTAPDQLDCFPFKGKDPFILEECPHVYFIGNQPQFETRLVERSDGHTRIICLPEFSKTKQLVLLNMKSLNVYVVVLDQ